MSCLIARTDEMFEELLFRSVIPRVMESRRPVQRSGLFDLSVQPIRVMGLEPRIRREEDAERWDGLS
jgi:hypothetical protein